MDALESLVSSARKRSIANLVAEQAAAGLCAALAGFLLLLIAGSDALSWPWLVLLFGGGAAYSAWRTWRGLPSLYQVAQRIDQRLELSDTLSTAIAFNTTPSHSSESMWRLQREAAQTMSAKYTPAKAAPLHMPRQTKWLGGLLIATVALLALRLGVLGSLDLRHPLVTGLSEYLPSKVASDTPEGLAAQAKAAQDGKSKEEGKDEAEAEQKQEAQQDAQAPDASNDMGQNTTGDQQDQGDPQDQGDQSPMNAQNDQQSQSDQQREGRESENSQPGDQNQSESNQQQASNNKQNDQQSLMDKIRDSVANLMNKMQPQKGSQNNNQKQNSQQQQQQGQKDQQADKNQGENQQGEQSAEKQQGNSQNSDKADQNDSSASPTNQKSAANDPKTGHGTQDGSKEIAKAQQLEAMGKITELIGQRSKTLEGEIMMDRKSSQQHELKTAYSEKNAFHREAGSDLRRDEVPVELQHYIQQYFTKIRQAPPVKAAKD